MTTITRTRGRRGRWLAALAALMLAGSISAAVPTSAQAATSCGGTLVRSLNFKNPNNGQIVAKLGVYRSGSKFCTVAVKAGPLYGVSSFMRLRIQGDFIQGPLTLEKLRGYSARDEGYFKYQTDALTIDTTRFGNCAHVTLEMKSKNGNWLPNRTTTTC